MAVVFDSRKALLESLTSAGGTEQGIKQAVSGWTAQHREALEAAGSSSKAALSWAFKQAVVRGAVVQPLFDAGVELVQAGDASAVLPFELMEVALARSPIAEASKLFATLERRRDLLLQPTFIAPKGRERPHLSLLRLGNGLLRRLGPGQHTALRARVLLLLAYLLPIDERSGVNVRGTVNTKCITTPLPEAALRAEDVEAAQAAGVDLRQHERFWGAHRHFAEPAGCLVSASALETTKTAVKGLLEAIAAFTETTGEAAAARKQAVDTLRQQAGTGTAAAGQADSDGDNEDDDDEMGGGAAAGTTSRSLNDAKFLTAPQLFHLQLRDACIRRQVLTETCFLLAALQHPALYKPLAAALRASLQSDVDDPAKPAADKELGALFRQCLDLLRRTPPGFEHFAAHVQAAIQSERHWAGWKVTGCKAVAPATTAGVAEQVAAAEAAAKDGKPPGTLLAASDAAAPTPADDPMGMMMGIMGGGLGLPKADPAGWASEGLGRKLDAVMTDEDRRPRRGLARHTEPLKEALDPDSFFGGDATPWTDAEWMWRANRLLAEEQPLSAVSGADLAAKSQVARIAEAVGLQREVPGEKERLEAEVDLARCVANGGKKPKPQATKAEQDAAASSKGGPNASPRAEAATAEPEKQAPAEADDDEEAARLRALQAAKGHRRPRGSRDRSNADKKGGDGRGADRASGSGDSGRRAEQDRSRDDGDRSTGSSRRGHKKRGREELREPAAAAPAPASGRSGSGGDRATSSGQAEPPSFKVARRDGRTDAERRGGGDRQDRSRDGGDRSGRGDDRPASHRGGGGGRDNGDRSGGDRRDGGSDRGRSGRDGGDRPSGRDGGDRGGGGDRDGGGGRRHRHRKRGGRGGGEGGGEGGSRKLSVRRPQ